MPSKKIRSKTPSISGGGGGTPDVNVPTARWSDDASADDSLGALLVAEPENTQIDDSLAYLIVKEGEDTNVEDAWSQFIAGAYGEDTQANDLAKLQLVDVDVARTGTPDADLMFDAWIDQLTTGINHGNESLQVKGASTVPGSDAKQGFIAIDLTGFTGCIGAAPNFTLVLQVANSNLVLAASMGWAVRSVATKPFTESTVTWAAPPTLGTSLATGSISVAAGGGFATYTISVAPATWGAACGNWMLVNFQGTAGALPDTFTIKSRDDATASNRPKFSLTAQRGT